MSSSPPQPDPLRASSAAPSGGLSPPPGRTLSPTVPARPNSAFLVKRPAQYSPSPPNEALLVAPSTTASTPGTLSGPPSVPLERLEIPSGTSSKPPGRRVQWPVDLKSPIGGQASGAPIPLQTLDDTGAKEALRTALDALELHDGGLPRPSFAHSTYDVESQVTSEGTTRAPSEAGSEADMEDVRDQMDIYVDPNETDGMPSLNPEKDAKRNQDAAVALVRAHTSGFFGVLRKRRGQSGANKQAATAAVAATAATPTREEPPDDGTGAFGRRLRDGGRFETNYDELPEPPRHKSKNTGGVLASLLALQGGSDSASIRSVATSSAGSTSRPGSQYGSDDDDEDEERERLKFIHEYRVKNAWLKTPGISTPGGKVHQRTISAISPDEIREPAPNRYSASVNDFVSNRTTAIPSSPGSPGSPPTTADSATYLRAPKKSAASTVSSGFKKLGGSLGLEIDQRPSSAKSSAGVFGGLMMATVRLRRRRSSAKGPLTLSLRTRQNNITGAASPGASKVSLALSAQRGNAAD
jgi:hypothetical protein